MESPVVSHSEKPVVIILHGDDDYAMQRMLKELRAKVSEDPGMAELNTAQLDGRHASEEEIRTAANSLPFLANRRLVILSYPFAKLTSPEARNRFMKFMDDLPSTTGLILVVEDHPEKKKGWDVLSHDSWIMDWVNKHPRKVLVREYMIPHQTEMPGWIRKEAERQGGKITPQAASMLAGYIGNEPAMVSQEISKLLTYVDFKRPVEIEDVEELTAHGEQVDIFKMVDCMASGDAPTALRMLHGLLDEREPVELFSMIVRQFRLLLQTREILDEGGGVVQVLKEVDHRDFVAAKLTDQARSFSMTDLEEIFHQLLQIDEAAKTSQMQLDLAMDTFIAGLNR
jgi:DNA polymerase-3 subunit delta